MFFYPSKLLVRTPADIGLRYEDVYFKSGDGVRLHGWYLPAVGAGGPGGGATILHLHGNAENMSTHIGAVHWLPPQGFDVFLFDYRGFGHSSGEPDISGALEDARAALEVAASLSHADPLIVFGQSLGGALAAQAIVDSPVRAQVAGLIMDSAFSDYRGIVRDKLAEFWLTWPLQVPISWLFHNDYSPLQVIDRISPIPLLIVHAEFDPIVPVRHARQLFERAREPKTLWILPQDEHTALTAVEDARLRLLRYLRTLVK